jgi:hypothetical protein
MGAIDLEYRNLRNHVESMMEGVLSIIDARSDKNITQSAGMLKLILDRIAELDVHVVGGDLFLMLPTPSMGGSSMVPDGKSSSTVFTNTWISSKGVKKIMDNIAQLLSFCCVIRSTAAPWCVYFWGPEREGSSR